MVTGKGSQEALSSHPEFAGLGGEGIFTMGGVCTSASGGGQWDPTSMPLLLTGEWEMLARDLHLRRSLWPNEAELLEFPSGFLHKRCTNNL